MLEITTMFYHISMGIFFVAFTVYFFKS